MGINLDEAFPDKWLKAHHLDPDQPVIVTVQEIMGVTTFKDGNTALDIKFAEFDQILGANKTNREMIATLLGSRNTDHWIGKQVVLYVDKVRNQQGAIVDALRIQGLKKAPVAPRRPIVQQQRRPIVLEAPYEESEDPSGGMADLEEPPF